MTLKSKYILFITLLLLAIIGLFSYSDLLIRKQEIDNDQKEKVRLTADIIENGLVTIMLQGRGREFQKFLEAVINGEVDNAWIFKPDGRIISSSNPEQIGSAASLEYIERFKSQKSPEVYSRRQDDKSVYSVIIPIFNEHMCGKCHGRSDEVLGILAVEVSTGKTILRLNGFKKRTAIFFVATLFIAAFSLGIFTAYLVSRPLNSIINAMKKAETGDMTANLFTERKDEIGKLASSLNSMLSEREKARNKIQKSHIEEMQSIEKMATLGEMASAIAHEIKNPLAGISGAIQVLAEDFPANDPHRDVIIEVLSEIERLDRAVKDLLTFARPPEIHPIATPLQPIVEHAKTLIEPQAKKQGVIIRVISGENVGDINVDPEQMQQVFLKIMQNNLQSMPAGGILTIATDFRPDENGVEIIFSDTGQHMEENDLKNIFKPFFTTKHIAAGLGLAISRNIVEKHSGRMTVESQVGIGTTFHVMLKINMK